MLSKEKRRFPRLNLHAPLSVKLRGTPEFANVISEDVSVGGVSFITNTFIAPATPVNLEINILSRVLSAAGKTIWAQQLPHSYRNRVGVEFSEFNQKEKEYLSDFIDMHTSQ